MKYHINYEAILSKLKVVIWLIVALFALTACASTPPTETAIGTEEATVKAAASAAPVNNECLICHTDKQRLIDTAKPVVVAEKESKGVG